MIVYCVNIYQQDLSTFFTCKFCTECTCSIIPARDNLCYKHCEITSIAFVMIDLLLCVVLRCIYIMIYSCNMHTRGSAKEGMPVIAGSRKS